MVPASAQPSSVAAAAAGSLRASVAAGAGSAAAKAGFHLASPGSGGVPSQCAWKSRPA